MSRRPTPNVTPFIPPLNTPEAPSSAPPPVPSPGGPLAGWASLPQNPNNYPAFPGGAYPQTPYTTTPFIPSMSAHNTPVIPMGSYTPAAPPAAAIPPMQAGLSADYIGYPQLGPTPWGPTTPLPGSGGPPPGTPWAAPMSAPAHAPPGTPWGPPAHPPAYPPFNQPMSAAFPGMAGGPPPIHPAMPPPMARPQAAAAWGMPPAMPGGFPHTPAMGMAADPWGAPPAWAQPAMAAMAPPPGPLRRAAEHEGDRMNPFTMGDHYGPVLEPFLVKVVKSHVLVNPLLAPPPDDSDRPFLKWNMLFPSAYTQRSTDPSTMSWITGRDEPASFPRVTFLRLISKSFPWMITVRATKRHLGVTCGEVIDAIAENMYRLASETDFNSLDKKRQKTISENYRRNRSRAHGVPGGRLGEGIKRLDWFGTDSMYGGIERDDRLVKDLCGDVLPCTFSLKCIRRYPMSEQEIKDHEARERTMREHARSLNPSAASASSVRTSTDSDDEDED